MKKTTLTALGVSIALLAGQAALANEHEGKGHHGKHMEHMLKKIDTNGDGTISKAEHNAASAAHFKKMDANNDGNISAAEREAKRAEWQAKREQWRKEHPKADATK